MSSISIPSCLTLARLNANGVINSVPHRQLPITPATPSHLSKGRRFFTLSLEVKSFARNGVGITNSVPPRNGTYTVGDFMTRKENLHVVKTTTTVEEALERLVERRITGFPVIDDDWKLVGVVSDYDLLALDSISGGNQNGTNLFPNVNSSWKTFNELQRLLSKTNGKVVGDLMTPAPLIVHENTNLEDAARLLLETKYRRLPVVDGDGKLVGLITRGNVVRAALQIKREVGNEEWVSWHAEPRVKVGRDEVVKAVSKLMSCKEQEVVEIRKRAKELGDKAKRAIENGGSSFC